MEMQWTIELTVSSSRHISRLNSRASTCLASDSYLSLRNDISAMACYPLTRLFTTFINIPHSSTSQKCFKSSFLHAPFPAISMTSLAKHRAHWSHPHLYLLALDNNLSHSSFVSRCTLALPTVSCLRVLIKLPQLARTHQILSHQSSLSTPIEPRRTRRSSWFCCRDAQSFAAEIS